MTETYIQHLNLSRKSTITRTMPRFWTYAEDRGAFRPLQRRFSAQFASAFDVHARKSIARSNRTIARRNYVALTRKSLARPGTDDRQNRPFPRTPGDDALSHLSSFIAGINASFDPFPLLDPAPSCASPSSSISEPLSRFLFATTHRERPGQNSLILFQ